MLSENDNKNLIINGHPIITWINEKHLKLNDGEYVLETIKRLSLEMYACHRISVHNLEFILLAKRKWKQTSMIRFICSWICV